MSDLNLNGIKWPEVSRDKWQEKLKKELKIENLSDKTITLEPSVIYDPFKSKTDFQQKSIKAFPSLSYGQRILCTDDRDSNASLLKLLQNDLRIVHLHAKESTDWTMVLKDVFPELIHLDIHFESKKAKENFKQYKSNQPNKEKWSVSCQSQMASDNDIPHFNYKDWNGLSQAEIIRCFLKEANQSNATKVMLSLSIRENLLEIIPFIRAQRIAFENLFPQKKLLIEVNCPLTLFADNKNDELIRAGSIYLFSSMAGADHLYLCPIKKVEDIHHSRLLLNVQNIMTLESKVDDKKDPLAGSFIIEDLTRQILEASS